MSGHSKWATTKHRKAAVDAKRSKLFSKLSRIITVAAKTGGDPNPANNASLAAAIEKAKGYSLPKDKIQSAIDKAFGAGEGATFEEITYEGYGPAGVAIMVSCLTDNRNRTVAELRNIFSKSGGNLGESGCVSWLFDKKGLIQIPSDSAEEDAVILATMDAGAEDVRVEEDTIEVLCQPEDLPKVRDAVTEAGIEYTSAELTMLPKNTVTVDNSKEASRVLRLMDALEDNDDVQQAYANFDIPDEIMQEAAA